MPLLTNERHIHYNTRLGHLLQNTASNIRSYHGFLSTQAQHLLAPVNHLWDRSQRYRLVASTDKRCATALLSECQDAHQSICHSILQMNEMLDAISSDVADFDMECICLSSELEPEPCPNSVAECREWLNESLHSLQSQLKCLEIASRLLLPPIMQQQTVDEFKTNLKLGENTEALLCMGLARAEQQAVVPLLTY
ncbi:uncharacterized protein LOC111064938 isoform X2 [Drosophila obscura]|uniref:uncharacterized protein LOC111064938 isoform X2 n=1 Tax=Drosophila obscura TaxID=7282 RepID=UPI001BB15427|nr:uncharacterized protein LOC111064938 isoform X2 [Drosophila obscura]